MTTVSEPFVTVTIVNATEPVGNTPQKVLFVGQQTSVGTATSGALQINILNDSSWDTLYGENSVLAGMIRAGRKENAITQFDAIGLDDAGGGVAATGTFVVSGTPTTSGTITFSVGSEINNTFSIPVATTDTPTTLGDAIEAEINGTVPSPNLTNPVSAVNVTGTVTLTAINLGTLGNFIGLAMTNTAAGITVATTAMVSGATDPTLASVFDVVGDRRYQGIVWAYGSDVSELVSFLDPRFNVNNDVLDGAGIVSVTDTFVNHITRLGSLNSENLVEICDTTETTDALKGPAQLELPAVKASMLGVIRGLRLTDGANITQFVTSTNGVLDATGGPALASKPYFNTPFPNLPLIPTGLGFTATEITQLRDAGGVVIGNNPARTGVVLSQCPTTYKTDAAGNPDITFKWLNFRDTASGSREYFFNNLKARFTQSRLTAGDVIRGRDIVNDMVIQAFIEKLYQDLSGPDFVLVQAGDDEIAFFKDNLFITLDLAAGEATVQMETPIVTQLRSIPVTQKIAFSIEG